MKMYIYSDVWEFLLRKLGRKKVTVRKYNSMPLVYRFAGMCTIYLFYYTVVNFLNN